MNSPVNGKKKINHGYVNRILFAKSKQLKISVDVNPATRPIAIDAHNQ